MMTTIFNYIMHRDEKIVFGELILLKYDLTNKVVQLDSR